MNKRKKRSEKLDYQWVRVKKWLSIFPVPPTKMLLLLILVPLPFLVMHAALKKFKEIAALRRQNLRPRQQLTPLQKARLLKSLKKRRLEKKERAESHEEKGLSDKDV